MKKTSSKIVPHHKKKGFLALAGEALHVLGEEIVEGKNKVAEVATEKFTAVKGVIQKITHKNAAPTPATAKKSAKKAAPKKTVKKAAGKVSANSRKVVKKTLKKATPAKRKAK